MILNGKIIVGTEQNVGMGKIGLFAGDDDQMYIKLSDGTILPIIAGSSSLALDSNYVRVDGTNGPYSQFDFNSGDGIDSSGILNIGGSSTIVNIGGAGSLVNIFGTTSYISATDLEVTDKLITLNKGGSTASAFGSGFAIEESGSLTGYVKVNNTREGYLIKAPGSTWSVDLLLTSLTSDRNFNFPNSSGTIALTSDIPLVSGVYLPLTGGTMTGTISFDLNNTNSITGSAVIGITYSNRFSLSDNSIFLPGYGGALLESRSDYYVSKLSVNSNYSFWDVRGITASNAPFSTSDPTSTILVLPGGNIYIQGNTSTKTQVINLFDGYVALSGINSYTSIPNQARLKTNNLTNHRTFEFPNASGTISLEDYETNILGVTSSLYTISNTDYILFATASTTLTLPLISSVGVGKKYKIHARNTTIDINRSGSDTIDGATFSNLTGYSMVTLRALQSGDWAIGD
jgi:hypothetical protein